MRGYYGTAFIPPNPYWAIGGQVLVGAAKGNFFANSAEFPGTLVGLWSKGTDVSFAAGVPIDYNISPALAFRIQPGYWLTTFGSSTQLKNLGWNAGLVYRFGRQ